MAYYTDLMEMKNDTARKNAIRERIATVIEKAMIEEFGAENVRRMKNTIAAAVGGRQWTHALKLPRNVVLGIMW